MRGGFKMEKDLEKNNIKKVNSQFSRFIIRYNAENLEDIMKKIKSNGFSEDPKERIKFDNEYFSIIKYKDNNYIKAQTILKDIGIVYERETDVYIQNKEGNF
jgi:CCR4-NOT transcriptional regulation complex NOT5 subunit